MELQNETIEKKGVYVVVYRLDEKKIKYLVLKRAEDWTGWELLKGGVDKDETPKKTAEREVKEEAGLDIEAKLSKEKNIFYSEKNNAKLKHVMTVFFAKSNSEEVQISNEHSEYKWVSSDEAMDLLSFEDIKELLKKVNEEIIEFENL